MKQKACFDIKTSSTNKTLMLWQKNITNLVELIMTPGFSDTKALDYLHRRSC